MAEDHRRVEPRAAVAIGMRTDPERIRAIEAEAARSARGWRNPPPPEKRFGAVLAQTPAAEQELEGEPAPLPTHPTRGDQARPDAPRAPPDPRMRALHDAVSTGRAPRPLDAAPPAPTPPTGEVLPRRR